MSFAGGFAHIPQGGRNPTTNGPQTTVELTVSCSGLSDRDLLSKSDPVCVLYTAKQGGPGQWEELERTERQMNTLNPHWTKKFVLEYRFEEKQLLKFLVFDKDNKSTEANRHDSLGEIECSLGEIVSAQSRGFNRPLARGTGTLRVAAVELSGCKEVVQLSFSAKGLENKDTFGKSDPYLQISRMNGTLIHRTETIDNNLNPTWKLFSLDKRSLCGGGDTEPVLLSVYDFDNNGDHDLIGSLKTTVKQLQEAPSPQFPLINEKKAAKKGAKYKHSGLLILNSIRVERVSTFLDYIQGGLQVNFTIGIDFTGSNGNPTEPSSLHYMDPEGKDNQYAVAIKAVGDIIQDYDYDKMFPCLGFGARIPPYGEVSHEFFLTLDPRNPFCPGLPGIINAYQRCLSAVTLYGPTNFSPVIEHVAQFARAHQGDARNYFILLIITDGVITDVDATKRSIVNASLLPMSIIIVGVGEEEFSAMEALDGDRIKLSAGGKNAGRDIVQFVELRKFINEWTGGVVNKERLAKAVLAEMPNQVVEYMKQNGFQPAAHP